MMQSGEKLENQPKYLVVDDEIAKKESAQQGFCEMLGIPLERGIFAQNYEEACSRLQSDSHIVLCFIDCILPENQEKYLPDPKLTQEYQSEKYQLNLDNPNEHEWGIKLITEIKDLKTFVFSAHLSKYVLEEIAKRYSNIIGYSTKPLKSEDFQVIKEPDLKLLFTKAKDLITSSSTSSPVSKSFDYDSLDKDLSLFIQEKTQEIKRLARRSTQDVIDIGKYLIEIKEKLGFGNFYAWLDAEFSWSPRTATRFMSVAHKFSSASLSDLNILPSALYQLASPSAPEEATVEAFERAKQGETITEKTAIEIKSKYKKSPQKISKNTEQISENTEVKTVELEPNRKRSLLSPTSSSVPKKSEPPRQAVLKVVPGQKAVKNSWWQLGKNHQLFCGEPKSKQFLAQLPPQIALTISCPPKNNYSLIPEINSDSDFSFRSKYRDLNVEELQEMLEHCALVSTGSGDIVVFSYVFAASLLNVLVKLGCHCYVAEPDLDKCESILAIWRETEFVERIRY